MSSAITSYMPPYSPPEKRKRTSWLPMPRPTRTARTIVVKTPQKEGKQ